MSTPKVMSKYRCGCCGRRLRYATRTIIDADGRPAQQRYGRWITSRFTGARYCYPTEGCNR